MKILHVTVDKLPEGCHVCDLAHGVGSNYCAVKGEVNKGYINGSQANIPWIKHRDKNCPLRLVVENEH